MITANTAKAFPGASMLKFYSLMAIGLLALMSNSYAAQWTCPPVEKLQNNPGDGSSYSAMAVGGNWEGKNSTAEASLVGKLKFERAAIKTGQDPETKETIYYVSCDYGGTDMNDYLRLSRRFTALPKAVGTHWQENLCSASSVEDCGFEP